MPLPSVQDVHINTAMSNISVAYRNGMYIADQIFPVVPVVHRSDYFFIKGDFSW